MTDLAAAVSRNDLDAAVSMFSENAVVIGGPCSGDTTGGFCVGRTQISASVHDSDPVHVMFSDINAIGDGNTVTFRSSEAFSLPPEAQALGLQRMIENGTAVIEDGKIDRLAMVPDLTDSQTVAMWRFFATESPPSGVGSSDGQTLSSQSAATQNLFRSVYGDRAAEEWVTQHQAAMAQ